MDWGAQIASANWTLIFCALAWASRVNVVFEGALAFFDEDAAIEREDKLWDGPTDKTIVPIALTVAILWPLFLAIKILMVIKKVIFG